MIPTMEGDRLSDRIEAAAGAMAAAFDAIRGGSRGGFRGTENLITMSQVRALLALAAAGSFVDAAQASNLSQPSLHRAVRDVERLSGVPLVERRGRGVRLTQSGQRLARGFSLAIAEVQAALDELAPADTGRIRIGAMPLARARLLPLAIARFHALRPAARIEIEEGPHPELIERLRDGRLDFLIGALRDPSPAPDVTQKALFDDRLVIVAGRGHPLAGTGAPSLEQLTKYKWVVARPGAPLLRVWRALFEDAGVAVPRAPGACGAGVVVPRPPRRKPVPDPALAAPDRRRGRSRRDRRSDREDAPADRPHHARRLAPAPGPIPVHCAAPRDRRREHTSGNRIGPPGFVFAGPEPRP